MKRIKAKKIQKRKGARLVGVFPSFLKNIRFTIANWLKPNQFIACDPNYPPMICTVRDDATLIMKEVKPTGGL